MKKLYLSALLLAPIVWKLACSPPPPRENAPLALSSDGGGPGGATNKPDLPSFGDGLGGAGGAGTTCAEISQEDVPFTKENLLESVASCTRQRLCEFEAAAIALRERAATHTSAPSPDGREQVQSAFFAAMLRWSRLEMFQFGPQASAKKDPEAGRGLRDLIYSWPNVSRCRVEEQVFGKAYSSAGFDDLIQVPINARGLFAVEYLSFYEGSDNDCSQFSVTNAGDAWNQTPQSELTAMKLEYLEAVTRDVVERATALSLVWDESGENFSQALSTASAYPDQQTALNLVAHALLYLEVEVKDYKVGSIAGIYESAPLERSEVSFSFGGTALLQANLQGFRDLFLGCDGQGLGFDDWLDAAGHGELAADIRADLEEAFVFLDEFPDLSQASSEQLLELHAVIKAITDHLKGDLFGQGSPLGLTLPTSVEGDTD